MMSVALDEAISLRVRGQVVCARQFVCMSADLLCQLTDALVATCHALSQRGRQLPHLPSVHPLNSDCFRGKTARAAASWSDVLHRVIFVERARFFQKLRILSETLDNLSAEFAEAADDVATGTAVQPGESWDALECLHYDFNTCLRESEVTLKSFLRVLPADQLTEFATALSAKPAKRRVTARVGSRPRDIRASA